MSVFSEAGRGDPLGCRRLYVLECPGDRLNLTTLVLLVTDTCCPALLV